MKVLFQLPPELYSLVQEHQNEGESWNGTARLLLREALTNRKTK